MPTYLNFDCYDTLVRYSESKVACITDMVARSGRHGEAAAIVAAQGDAERELQIGPFKPLKEVLRRSLQKALAASDIDYREGDGDALEAAVRNAPPFGEAGEVLSHLARHFRLVIISNSEDDIIADNMAAIGAPFHDAVTAAQARAYKPDHRIFRFALDKLGCTKEDVVHVAAGFYHDIEPGHALGWRRVWINRAGQPGDPRFGPYDELPDLRGLPALLGV